MKAVLDRSVLGVYESDSLNENLDFKGYTKSLKKTLERALL